MNGLAQLQATQLARKGRHGDNKLLHVSDTEIAALDGVASLLTGKPLPTNPETGAKEAFLFTPLLMPLLANAGVLGGALGTLASGALGTGLLAGGAGALEAAARGMDNPIEQGMMAGLTAGGASAVGSALGAAGQGAGVGAVGGDRLASMAMQNAQVMGEDAVTGAMMLPPSAQQAAMNQLIEQPFQDITGAPELFVGKFPKELLDAPYMDASYMNATPQSTTFTEYLKNTPVDTSVVPMPGAGDASYLAAPALPPASPAASADTLGAKLSSGIANTTDRFAQMGQGLRNIVTNDQALGTFLKDPRAQYGALALGAGYTGQSMLEQRQGMEAAAAEKEAESQREWDQAYDAIRQNYMTQTGGVPDYVASMRRGGYDPDYLRRAGLPYAKGGSVFPMQTGGFVMTNKAVKGAGSGSEEKGLMALKKHLGAKPIRGKGHGTSDSIDAKIDGKHQARVSNGEAYVPPEKVKKAGGSRKMYETMRRLEAARKG